MYQQRIGEIYDHLSPGYRRVADFLLSHYHEAAFMTAAEVGRATQADTASVVRFAQRLGYPGFPELIGDVQEEVKRDLRQVYEPGPEENSPVAVFRRSLIQDRNSLDHMLLHPDQVNIEPVIPVLEAAAHIFVVAEGAAAPLAEAFVLRLRAFGFNAIGLPGDIASRAALTVGLQPNDACLGVTFGRTAPGVAVILKIAREEGARTIAIANSPVSDVARAAEHVLLAPANAVGLLYSMTAAAAVLHALVQVLAIRLGDKAAEWAMRVDYLLGRFAAVGREPTGTLRETLKEWNSPPDAQ